MCFKLKNWSGFNRKETIEDLKVKSLNLADGPQKKTFLISNFKLRFFDRLLDLLILELQDHIYYFKSFQANLTIKHFLLLYVTYQGMLLIMLTINT